MVAEAESSRVLTMQIAITGGTGFVGRHLVQHLTQRGHHCHLWRGRAADRALPPAADGDVRWVDGQLGEEAGARRLVENCDAIVHAALDRHCMGYHGIDGNVLEFVQKNLVGTLQLIEAARAAKVPRFVFISSCGVHDVILDDRPLDETHPLWPKSHYGAHKAAIEKFVHSYGLGADYPICALRPPQIYGVAHPPSQSKWYSLVRDVARGRPVQCAGGGKHVHAADVAKGVELLLTADAATITGQVYSCYDRYISEYEVAKLAQEISGSTSEIRGEPTAAKHQIVSDRIRALGMEFGGERRLRDTVVELVRAVSDE